MDEYWRVRLTSGDKILGISDYGTEEEARRLLSGLGGLSFTIVAQLEHWTKVSSESLEVVGKRSESPSWEDLSKKAHIRCRVCLTKHHPGLMCPKCFASK